MDGADLQVVHATNVVFAAASHASEPTRDLSINYPALSRLGHLFDPLVDAARSSAGAVLSAREEFGRWCQAHEVECMIVVAAASRGATRAGGGTGAAPRVPWIVSELPAAEEAALLQTLRYISDGVKPKGALGKRWGIRFNNRDGDLPGGQYGQSPYLEYRVAPPKGSSGPGARRVVVDTQSGAIYYTWTHYGQGGAKPAFVRVR